MRKIRGLMKSFAAALSGLEFAIKNERNVRIHIVAVLYVTLIAVMGKLDIPYLLTVLLLFALVIIAEIINTAIELTCDMITQESNMTIRAIKDLSAASVLVAAIVSVVIAAIIIIKTSIFQNLIEYANTNPILTCFFVLTIPLAAWFIFRKWRM